MKALIASISLVCFPWVASAADLRVEILPQFRGRQLTFDALTNVTSTGQNISVTRLDFLLSGIALHQANGAWIEKTNWFEFISGREQRNSFQLSKVPAGQYDALRFRIGLPAEINHGDPAPYPATHPLNPSVNGLHWNWNGGYVFFALEGGWQRADDKLSGYSYHIATDRQLMTMELPFNLDLRSDREILLALNVDRIFSPHQQIDDDTASTHSRTGDLLADELRRRIEGVFEIKTVRFASNAVFGRAEGKERAKTSAILSASSTKTETAPIPHPYRLKISRFFPRPALPLDNPLTEEGVDLGRQLFFEPLLSVNNAQSCASCHQTSLGFTDGRAASVGAQGQIGNRNAMALLNLAWKSSFFWDGRASSLREQVLQPIQNPIEMHESLTNVVAKLARTTNYPKAFEHAFGSSEITTNRLARALEQFLLAQVSHDSKFDRVLKGEASFTTEEQRGFELFHTEYDPRREQFGADCFHCHGGPLFQSQSFANNGLDPDLTDLGRYRATGKSGDKGKFSVPSLRNVAVTGPYMHDGRFTRLEEVIEHYTSGVKRSATLDPNLAKHPDGGGPLSTTDKRALLAFLGTLTDERFFRRSMANDRIRMTKE